MMTILGSFLPALIAQVNSPGGATLSERFKAFEMGGNRAAHFLSAFGVILLAIFMRRVVIKILFGLLRKHMDRIDARMLPSLAAPAAIAVMSLGIYFAIKILSLPPLWENRTDQLIKIVLLGVFFWGLLRGWESLADVLETNARTRGSAIAGFFPMLRKIARVVLLVLGALLILENTGYSESVKSLLAGLGIGGLAVALAAQDALTNFIGSLAVAIDRPFRVGDVVRVGGVAEGSVEEIGFRSTKIRTGAKMRVSIPNKTVASEAITNLTAMPKRRVDQTIGLTYSTTAEQMEKFLSDVRKLLLEDNGVDKELLVANFANFSESSLDVQIAFFTANPDWKIHMEVRERVNLKIMRLVTSHGLSMAFPTRTIQIEGTINHRGTETQSNTG